MKIVKGHYVPKELITSESVHEAVVKAFVAAGFKDERPAYGNFKAIALRVAGDGLVAHPDGGISWTEQVSEAPLTLQQLFTAENGLCWPDWAVYIRQCQASAEVFFTDVKDKWAYLSTPKNTHYNIQAVRDSAVLATAKRMGYINGYKYMEECTEKGKPNLPDDIIVSVMTYGRGRLPAGHVGFWNWDSSEIKSFRIVDERYKPADTSYLNAPTQAQSLTHSEEGLTHNRDSESVSETAESKCEAVSVGDSVKNPKHYQVIEGVESITIIASAMTVEQWHGFCLGNILKYRIRAGKKGDLQQDIAKADYYQELYEMHKHLCRDAS